MRPSEIMNMALAAAAKTRMHARPPTAGITGPMANEVAAAATGRRIMEIEVQLECEPPGTPRHALLTRKMSEAIAFQDRLTDQRQQDFDRFAQRTRAAAARTGRR